MINDSKHASNADAESGGVQLPFVASIRYDDLGQLADHKIEPVREDSVLE